MWRFILILLIIIFLASIYSPVLLLAFFLLFFVYSLKFIDKAFLLFCYLLSFNGVIRLFNLENPISAALITILTVELFLAFIIIFLVKRLKLKVKRESIVLKLFIGFFIILIGFMFISSIRYSSFTIIFFNLREFIIPLLIIPISIYIFSFYKNIKIKVIYFIVLGVATVAAINLYHYFIGLNTWIPRYVLHDGSQEIAVRELFSFQIKRMYHILGLSTGGAAGAYYATFSYISFVLFKHYNKVDRNKSLILLLSMIVLALCIVFTISFSSMLAFVFCFILDAWIRFNKISSIKRLFIVVILPLMGVFILFGSVINVNGYTSMSEYVLDMTDDFSYRISLLDYSDLLFGIGLISKSVANLSVLPFHISTIDLLLVDQWIIVVLYQMGIFGFFSMVFTLILAILSVYYLYQNKKGDYIKIEILCAGLVIAGFFGFAHGAFIIERLFSTILFICFAFILSNLLEFEKS